MFSRWEFSLVALVILVSSVAPSFALAEGTMRVGIAGFAGFNSYGMKDVNDELIAPLNASLAASGIPISLNDISSGLGFGGGLHALVRDKWMVLLDYERLLATSSDKGDVSGTPVELEVKTPANGFTLTGVYMLPSTSKTRFGFGAGVGYYSTGSHLKVTAAGSDTSASFDAKGPGFHGVAMADIAASDVVHVEGAVGYRYAKSGQVEDSDGAKLVNSDGSESKIDWSGFIARLGLTAYLGKKQ